MPDFTHKNMKDVKDSAPEFGMEDVQEARFAKEALDAERTGLTHLRLKDFSPRCPRSTLLSIVLLAAATLSSLSATCRRLRRIGRSNAPHRMNCLLRRSFVGPPLPPALRSVCW